MSPDQGVLLGAECRQCHAPLPEYPGVGRPRSLCDECYPPRAPARKQHEVPAPLSRRSDPVTSIEAAASVDARAVEARILEAFAQFGLLNDDELAGVLDDLHPPTVKTARSRLAKAGCLVDSGRTRPSNRGRAMACWEVAP